MFSTEYGRSLPRLERSQLFAAVPDTRPPGYATIGAAMAVHRELLPGFLELVFRTPACCSGLLPRSPSRGVPARSSHRQDAGHRAQGRRTGTSRPPRASRLLPEGWRLRARIAYQLQYAEVARRDSTGRVDPLTFAQRYANRGKLRLAKTLQSERFGMLDQIDERREPARAERTVDDTVIA
jgi:hypothetical protein